MGELSYTGCIGLFYCEERAVWGMVWKLKGAPAGKLNSLNVVCNNDFLGVQTFKSCQPF